MCSATLEIEHRIYKMLQHFWTCDCSFFCHMTDKKDRRAVCLCILHNPCRAFPYLSYASRCRRKVLSVYGLNRINYGEFWREFGDFIKDVLYGGLRKNKKSIGAHAHSLGPHFYLLRRFLTRDIENAPLGEAYIIYHLKGEGGFSNSGIASYKCASMQFAVGYKMRGKSAHAIVDAEDALIAALKLKVQHPEALITYVRHPNKRGDARHPMLDFESESL